MRKYGGNSITSSRLVPKITSASFIPAPWWCHIAWFASWTTRVQSLTSSKLFNLIDELKKQDGFRHMIIFKRNELSRWVSFVPQVVARLQFRVSCVKQLPCQDRYRFCAVGNTSTSNFRCRDEICGSGVWLAIPGRDTHFWFKISNLHKSLGT